MPCLLALTHGRLLVKFVEVLVQEDALGDGCVGSWLAAFGSYQGVLHCCQCVHLGSPILNKRKIAIDPAVHFDNCFFCRPIDSLLGLSQLIPLALLHEHTTHTNQQMCSQACDKRPLLHKFAARRSRRTTSLRLPSQPGEMMLKDIGLSKF